MIPCEVVTKTFRSSFDEVLPKHNVWWKYADVLSEYTLLEVVMKSFVERVINVQARRMQNNNV